jgi:hypothetical protein
VASWQPRNLELASGKQESTALHLGEAMSHYAEYALGVIQVVPIIHELSPYPTGPCTFGAVGS